MSSLTTPIRVLIAGGSYAGITAALNLLDISLGRPGRSDPDKPLHKVARNGLPIEVHLVDERDGFLALIGCPLAFASQSYAEKIWRHFGDIPALQHPNFRFTHARIVSVDPEKRSAKIQHVASGGTFNLDCDYFLAATGLGREYPSVPASILRKDYVQETTKHIARTKSAGQTRGIAIIGGGAVGIEMAAELKVVNPDAKILLIHSRDHLLSSEPLPLEFAQAALDAIQELGVETILSRGRVQETTTNTTDNKRLTFQDGTSITVSMTLPAISNPTPTTSYLPPSSLDEHGLVKIDKHLTFPPHPPKTHYAIGDVASCSGIKRCGSAIHLGALATHNIYTHILSSHYGVDVGGVEEGGYVEYPDGVGGGEEGGDGGAWSGGEV